MFQLYCLYSKDEFYTVWCSDVFVITLQSNIVISLKFNLWNRFSKLPELKPYQTNWCLNNFHFMIELDRRKTLQWIAMSIKKTFMFLPFWLHTFQKINVFVFIILICKFYHCNFQALTDIVCDLDVSVNHMRLLRKLTKTSLGFSTSTCTYIGSPSVGGRFSPSCTLFCCSVSNSMFSSVSCVAAWLSKKRIYGFFDAAVDGSGNLLLTFVFFLSCIRFV